MKTQQQTMEKITFLKNLQELNNSLIDWFNEGTGLTPKKRQELFEQIRKNQEILNKEI
jgi:hypothetical protein